MARYDLVVATAKINEMNILIIHHLSDSQVRKTSVDHARCFERYAPQHNYMYFDVCDQVTDALRSIPFDAVIIDPTALCIRYFRPRQLFQRALAALEFVRELDAVKVAFPQDDNDHSALLDEWLYRWRVDIIYSVYWENRDAVYVKSGAHAEILAGLTGYVEDRDIELLGRYALPLSQRSIDISYRARKLPPQFGRYGQMKAGIGSLFREGGRNNALSIDVSCDPADVIYGENWLHFLGNSKWCLGSEGGSSILDPYGEIRDRCEAFLAADPDASFEEVEAACFPGEDGRHRFSSPSPRLFEAAMMRCGQILVEAPYYGVLRPQEHYIPLRPDGANLPEVLDQARDLRLLAQMTEACYADLVATPRFRYSTHVQDTLMRIEDIHQKRKIRGCDRERFEALQAKHYRDLSVRRKIDAAFSLLDRIRTGCMNKLFGNPPRANRVTQSSKENAPSVCVLAVSDITYDPRVRRQCDALTSAGFHVTAVGLPSRTEQSLPWALITPAPHGETPSKEGGASAGGPASHKAISIREWQLWTSFRSGVARLVRWAGYLARPAVIGLNNAYAERIYWSSGPWVQLYNLAKPLQCDIWVANDWNTLPIAARLAQEHGGRIIYDSHEFAIEEYSQNWRWRLATRPVVAAIEKNFIKKAAAVLTVSGGIAKRLNKHYRLPQPAVVIRNTPGYSECSFRPTGERIRVLYHGIVAPGRGLEAAIESVQFWNDGVSLYIRGPASVDYQESLVGIIESLKLTDRVFLLPPVPMVELVKCATEFDVGIFALPDHSLHNEFALPNKFFEYAMAGLALCVSDLPEMSPLVQRHGLGRTFRGLSPRTIADTINAFTRDQIDECKRNSLHAARELCWEAESEKLISVVKGLLSTRGE